jgi:hypothetical protein
MNTQKFLILLKILLSFIFLLILVVIFFLGIEQSLGNKITIPFIKQVVLVISQLL